MKNSLGIVLLLVCGVFGSVTDKEESVSVNEGDSVTLHTNITDMQKDDVVTWSFKKDNSDSNLADIEKNNIRHINESFKDRLQVNKATGDVTITNMKIKHSALYKAALSLNSGTTYKSFRVNVSAVSDSSQFKNAGTGDVKSVSVTEGESVTLYTDLTELQRDDLILWGFGDDGVLIAKVDNEDSKTSPSIFNDVLDGKFRDKLKLNDQTGSLTITNITTTDKGDYKLKISRNMKKTLYKTFSVYVSEKDLSTGGEAVVIVLVIAGVVAAAAAAGVICYCCRNSKIQVKEMLVKRGGSVSLESGITNPQSDDVTELIFGDQVIAIFNGTYKKLSGDQDNFRDEVYISELSGFVIMKNVQKEEAGLYKVKLSSSCKKKTCIQFIINGGPSYYQFNIIVTDEDPEEKGN